MIPWLGGFVALDAVEYDLHFEDALHVQAVEKRHGLPDELRLVSFLSLSSIHCLGSWRNSCERERLAVIRTHGKRRSRCGG